jgi:hypothetical protein
MGSLFDSRQTVTQDPGAAAAWSIAQPTQQYVNQAGTQFTQGVMSNPAYAGQRVADLNPYQTNAANTLGQFSQATSGIPNLFNSSGTTALNAGNTYGANAQNLYNQYAGADPTGQILGAANQYANNPYVNGMIDASNRDVARSLAEQDLPGIDRAASGTGNLNSSRAGVQSAIAARGASDRMADIASFVVSSLVRALVWLRTSTTRTFRTPWLLITSFCLLVSMVPTCLAWASSTLVTTLTKATPQVACSRLRIRTSLTLTSLTSMSLWLTSWLLFKVCLESLLTRLRRRLPTCQPTRPTLLRSAVH